MGDGGRVPLRTIVAWRGCHAVLRGARSWGSYGAAFSSRPRALMGAGRDVAGGVLSPLGVKNLAAKKFGQNFLGVFFCWRGGGVGVRGGCPPVHFAWQSPWRRGVPGAAKFLAFRIDVCGCVDGG